MSKLNGVWKFFYSETQAKENEDRQTFVDVDGGMKKYTECVHVSHTKHQDYTPHEERFEDSVVVGSIVDPTIKRGSLNIG